LRHLHPYPGLFNPDHLRLYYPRPERLTLDGIQLLEVEDIPPETLRARRRTRVSRRPTQTPATTTTIVARPNITTTHPFPEPPVTAYPSVAQPTITLTDTAGRTVQSGSTGDEQSGNHRTYGPGRVERVADAYD
jgi:hypothetical protein